MREEISTEEDLRVAELKMPRHLRAHSPANQSEGYPSKFGLLPLDEPIRKEHSSEP